jgi:ABC-type branched-subunit amino acid transport system substrate-binding protein
MKRLCALVLLCSVHLASWSANDIVIGQTADFSSVAGVQMKDFNAGALAAIARVNALGGIRGRQLRLQSLDDAFSADKASANARQLVDQSSVVALFGTRGTDPTEAVMKVAESARVPLIAPITGADTVRKSKMTFPVRASYRTEIDGMLRHMAIAPSRLSILVQNDKFGNPLAAFIEERIAQQYKGLELVGKVPFERKSTDLRAQAAQVLASNPNSVIALCNPSSCEAFIKQLLEQSRASGRPRPTVYQTSISDIYSQFAKIGPSVVQGNPYGQVLPDPHRLFSPLSKEYLAAMAMAKTNGPVNYRSFEGYISAKVLIEAVSRASTISSQGVQDALEGMGSVDLGGFSVRYSADNHQGSTYFDLVTMDKDGRLVH